MLKRLFLLVLAVLGVAMAVPKYRVRLEALGRPYVDQIRGKVVPRRLEVMADQLDVRLGRAEGFPTVFEGWLNRDYTSSPQDPWGNFYYLVVGRRDYTVGSKGPDGKQGSADDITLRRRIPGVD